MNNIAALATACIIATAVVWPHAIARAADSVAKKVNEIFLDAKLKEISKRQVMTSLLANNKTVVLRCSEVELSDKITIRRKK